MKIFIINLKSSLDRREFQLKQAQHLNVDVDFFEAISIDRLSEETYRNLYDTWERPLSKGEVCCFLSHKALWEKVIEENQPILILEDDAILSREIRSLLSDIKDLKNIDRINLEARLKKKTVSKKFQRVSNHRLFRVFVDRSGAAGYVLYPSGAQKLLHKHHNKAAIADKVERQCNLAMFQLEPSAVLPLDFCHHFGINGFKVSKASETTIKANTYKPQNVRLMAVMRCRIRRCVAQLRLQKQKLLCFFCGKKRAIQVQQSDFIQTSKFYIKDKVATSGRSGVNS